MAHVGQSSYTPAPPATAVLALIVAWFALLAAFYLHPSLDVEVSSFFFTGPLCQAALPDFVCGYFPLRRLQVVDRRCEWHFFKGNPQAHSDGQACGCDRKSLLGAGTNCKRFLKSYSGRPRPVQTSVFGGPFDFAAAGTFVGECAKNCSFVSGEASGAGWMLCLLFLLPSRIRLWVGPPLVAGSLIMAGLRVAVGAHYASDALLGWLLAIILFMALLIVEARIADKLKVGWPR